MLGKVEAISSQQLAVSYQRLASVQIRLMTQRTRPAIQMPSTPHAPQGNRLATFKGIKKFQLSSHQ
ncbi:MAG: hypothetical protein KME42_16760 [Tildeniella nuda ZEHNDER 1965/U140]|jgi:hypothetical protein|nr:hypothetical protein [Tildeniella nuda ZEHNDER 1965/U140]